MTPEEFVATWKVSTLSERAGAQAQFADLCRLHDEPNPSEADPSGQTYTFKKGAIRAPARAVARLLELNQARAGAVVNSSHVRQDLVEAEG